ncbi:MAG: hypothetical protein Q9165_006203 [Trypethelium subeluteriae]
MQTPFVLPGDSLGPTSKFRPGTGTHQHASHLYASLLGPISRSSTPATAAPPPPAQASSTSASKTPSLPALSIARPSPSDAGPGYVFGRSSTTTLPEVNSVVLGRVVRLRQREAVLEIRVVGEEVLGVGGVQGVVRAQDVRAMEKDRVKVGEMFRVGDVVRGVVISLGDQSSYYLSTARNDLGVIMATSEQGNAMYPISWREFKDPVTGSTEIRKVANPV